MKMIYVFITFLNIWCCSFFFIIIFLLFFYFFGGKNAVHFLELRHKSWYTSFLFVCLLLLFLLLTRDMTHRINVSGKMCDVWGRFSCTHKIVILQQKFNEICSKISSHGFSTTPTCILTVLLHKESIKGLFVHNFHFWIAQDEQEKIIYLFRAHNAKLGLISRTKYILSITYRRTNHVWKYFMDFEPNLTKNQKAYTKWVNENMKTQSFTFG